MKKIILVIVLFLAPFAVRAQSNPNSAPQDSGVVPHEPVIAQQSQSENPPPPPGRPVARRLMPLGDEPGAIVGYEPLGGGRDRLGIGRMVEEF